MVVLGGWEFFGGEVPLYPDIQHALWGGGLGSLAGEAPLRYILGEVHPKLSFYYTRIACHSHRNVTEKGDAERTLPNGAHHAAPPRPEREFFIDNLLVQIHFIIVMIRWTGLAPWEFELPFPGSLTSTFLSPHQSRPGSAPLERLVFYCQTTGASPAHAPRIV